MHYIITVCILNIDLSYNASVNKTHLEPPRLPQVTRLLGWRKTCYVMKGGLGKCLNFPGTVRYFAGTPEIVLEWSGPRCIRVHMLTPEIAVCLPRFRSQNMLGIFCVTVWYVNHVFYNYVTHFGGMADCQSWLIRPWRLQSYGSRLSYRLTV